MSPLQGIEYLKTVPEDEPVFVLRAKDRYAPATVASWASIVSQPVNKNTPATPKSLKKAHNAMQLVKEMKEWQEHRNDQVKIPD